MGYDKMEETLLAATIEEGAKFNVGEENLKEHLASINEEYLNYLELAISKIWREVWIIVIKGKRA